MPRLSGWDYASPAAYFVTICTHQRRPVLATVDADGSHPTILGGVVAQSWRSRVEIAAMSLERLLLMPDHVHAIVRISAFPRPVLTLDDVVRRFKADATRAARALEVLAPRQRLWQRGFFDRVIRSDAEYVRLAEYIDTNPLRWVLRHSHGTHEPSDKSDGYAPGEDR